MLTFSTLIMWNDTDTPLAYFITFRTCGTWLHGDERGSIDRYHNRYGSPYMEPDVIWHRFNQSNSESRRWYWDAAKGSQFTLRFAKRVNCESGHYLR